MSRLRVGLLINPTAAQGTARRVGREVGQLLRLAGISVVDLSGPTAHVARARAMDVRDTLTALVVVGGDGTASLGAEIVAQTPVRLGIVPAGSGNDLARALGVPLGDAEEAVHQLLHALSRPPRPVDAIEITSTPGAVPQHHSLALGNVNLGFDALVNARANSFRRRHPLRYTAAVVRELPSFSDLPFWIEVDGGPREDLDAALVSLCNTGVYGGGMRLAPDADLADGHLDLATLGGLRRAELLRFFPRVFRGTHHDVRGFQVRSARTVTVGLRHGRSVRAYADGDARALLPLTARVLPGTVRLLADPEAAPATS